MESPYETAQKILKLCVSLKKTCESPTEIADQINSILLYSDHLPISLISDSWDIALKTGERND